MFKAFLESKIITKCDLFNDLVVVDGNTIRQIDHLILTNRGIFIIETKHWRGDIYYNFSKEDLKKVELYGLSNYLYSPETNNYFTFVLTNTNNNLIFNKYGHPFQQVRDAQNVITKVLNGQYINLIVYFNHPESNLHIGTKHRYIKCADSKDDLKRQLLDCIDYCRYEINDSIYITIINQLEIYSSYNHISFNT
ncbi:nuclease-related domain-containing protein [Staphylococcus pettenkoferi]|uniref:nuclease-related domain-containing protein n=1 Tax=Staphylococcus pettenkoferi TaxID=170573 RepID=UPI003AEF3257